MIKLCSYFMIIVAILIVISGMDSNFIPFSIILILAINIYQLYACRKNIMLFLLMFTIAYSNYSILYANFISPLGFAYTSEISPTVTRLSLNILLLFNCVMMLLTNWTKINPVRDTIEIFETRKESGFLLFLITLILIYIFIWGFKRPTILGLRGSPRPIYEYSLVFFIMFFYFCGNSKRYKKLGLFIIVLFSLQNFIFGGRILGLQFLLCAFFILYAGRISNKYIASALIAFVILFNIIGIARGALLTSDISIQGVFTSILNEGFALDTAYSAYYTSQCFIYTYSQIDIGHRLLLFKEFLLGIFFGIEQQYVIQRVTKQYVFHSNGGVLPHYFFFYLGTFGVFVGNILISLYLRLINNLKKESNGLSKCIAIYVTCHTFRWYLYSPIGLLRGVLFMVIVYFVFTSLYKMIQAQGRYL